MSNRSRGKSHKSSYDRTDDSSKPNQFMIQVERQNEKLTMQDISDILEDTGIQLDPLYGPYLVNPRLGRYVVRGLADPKAEQKAKKIPGVILFKDAKVTPAREYT